MPIFALEHKGPVSNLSHVLCHPYVLLLWAGNSLAVILPMQHLASRDDTRPIFHSIVVLENIIANSIFLLDRITPSLTRTFSLSSEIQNTLGIVTDFGLPWPHKKSSIHSRSICVREANPALRTPKSISFLS